MQTLDSIQALPTALTSSLHESSPHFVRDSSESLRLFPDSHISGSEAGREGSFSSVLQGALGGVNHLIQESDKASENLAIGKSSNLHDAMIAFSKAETAFKFVMQLRNKALDAYHEVMRMQV